MNLNQQEALQKILTDADQSSEVSLDQLDSANLQNLTFHIRGFKPKVSIFHYLLITGQTKLFDYLVEHYQLTDLKPEQLAGPPLILIAIQLYLDAENFGQYYQTNQAVIFGESNPEYYFLFIKSLLKLGWTWLPVKYRLIEICLEMVVGRLSLENQTKLLQLYELLYQAGFQIGLRYLFKNQTIMKVIFQKAPKVYEYLRAHYSATLIQAVYRGHRCRKQLSIK